MSEYDSRHSPLTEALARNEEVFEPTWEESLLFADAARRWAELEALESIRWCPDHQCRWGYHPNCGWSPTGKPCPKLDARIILGEGAEPGGDQ